MSRQSFGERGGWWVAGQVVWFLLIGIAVFAGGAERATGGYLLVGVALAVTGVGLSLAGAGALGDALTSYPEPLEGQALVTSGVYGQARHPIYGGVILSFLGVAVAYDSLTGMILALGLIPFFWFKSNHEERRLSARYPDYAQYRERVHRRLIPWVL